VSSWQRIIQVYAGRPGTEYLDCGLMYSFSCVLQTVYSLISLSVRLCACSWQFCRSVDALWSVSWSSYIYLSVSCRSGCCCRCHVFMSVRVCRAVLFDCPLRAAPSADTLQRHRPVAFDPRSLFFRQTSQLRFFFLHCYSTNNIVWNWNTSL